MPVIGWLYNGMRNESFLSAFRQGPGRTQLCRGKSLAIEYRCQPARQRLPPTSSVAKFLVVVAAPDQIGIAPAKVATAVIPIVFE
jgi:hypothetical protein